MPRTALTFPKRQTVENLVVNGDFEYVPPFTAATTTANRYIDGTAGGSGNYESPYGWWTPSSFTASATAQFDTSVYRSGTASLKLSTLDATGKSNAASGNNLTVTTMARTMIPVLPSTSYTLTGWAKTNNVAANAVFIDALEYSLSLYSGGVITNSTSKISGTNDWTQLTKTFTTGASTRYILVVVRNNVAGNISDAWFDDITLVKSPVQTRTAVAVAPLPLVNAGFETAPPFTAATNVIARYIDGTAGGSATDVGYKWNLNSCTNSEAKFDSAVKYTGNYSMKLSTLSSGAIITAYQAKADIGFTVKPNTTYIMSYRIKTQVNSGSSASGAYGYIVRKKSDNTTISITYGTSVLTTQDWTTYSITVTTTPETAYLEPAVSINGSNGAGTLVMDAWFDDIEIKEVIPQRKTPDNLLSNGNFEYAPPFTAAQNSSGWINGTVGGSLSDGYQYGWGLNKSGTVSVQYDSTEKKFGTNSLKLSTLAVASYAEVNKYGSTSAPYYKASVIPALPNTTYTVTWWMKTNYVSGDSSQGATVGFIEWNGAFSATTFNSGPGATIKTTTDWTQYSFTVTTASTTRFVNVQPRIYGHTGTATLIMDAWFDDITLTTTAPYRNRKSIDNLVENGDFESAPTFVAATTASGWIIGTAAASTTSSAYKWRLAVGAGTVSAQFDNTVYKNGTGSMKIATNPGGYCEVVNSVTKEFAIPVLPSTSYTISGWMKTEAVSGSATSGARIIAAEYSGAFVGGNIAQTTNIQTTTDWTYYTKTFTTASTTSFIVASCNVRGDNGAATLSMNAWFDDITLVKN